MRPNAADAKKTMPSRRMRARQVCVTANRCPSYGASSDRSCVMRLRCQCYYPADVAEGKTPIFTDSRQPAVIHAHVPRSLSSVPHTVMAKLADGNTLLRRMRYNRSHHGSCCCISNLSCVLTIMYSGGKNNTSVSASGAKTSPSTTWVHDLLF